MFGIAYKATNLLNNKNYIGITKRSLERRRKDHVKASRRPVTKRTSLITKAIRKYGIENIIFEEIASAKTVADLKILEGLLVVQENTLAPNGYNLILPDGRGNFTPSAGTRVRQRRSHLGKRMTDEAKEKCRIAHVGKEKSAEHLEALRKAAEAMSPEARRERSRKGIITQGPETLSNRVKKQWSNLGQEARTERAQKTWTTRINNMTSKQRDTAAQKAWTFIVNNHLQTMLTNKQQEATVQKAWTLIVHKHLQNMFPNWRHFIQKRTWLQHRDAMIAGIHKGNGNKSLTYEQRSEAGKLGAAKMSKKQLRERALKAAAAQTPEERSDAVHRAWITRRVRRPAEQFSDTVHKAWTTRRTRGTTTNPEAGRSSTARADEFTVRVFTHISNLQKQGITDFQSIATALNEQGVSSRYNKKWNSRAVKHVLQRAKRLTLSESI